MKPHLPISPGDPAACAAAPRPDRRRAFSLIEVMVAASLLVVIVLGLLAMFDQTQRAFRGSMTQTDVLESGRALGDMIHGELLQIAASYGSNVLNLEVGPATVGSQKLTPLAQKLPGVTDARTNVLERFFFLTRSNQHWLAFDYQVLPEYTDAGVGSLYRYVSNAPGTVLPRPAASFTDNPKVSPSLGGGPLWSRVADGVVHFRVYAYNTNGLLLQTRLNLTNVIVTLDPTTGEPTYQFWSNALPASIELEYGVLEAPTLERWRSLADNPVAARDFLSKQAGRVHLFRQRVALPNASSAATP